MISSNEKKTNFRLHIMILSVVKCYIITGDCLFNLILNMVCGLIESYKTKENMLNPNKSDKR